MVLQVENIIDQQAQQGQLITDQQEHQVLDTIDQQVHLGKMFLDHQLILQEAHLQIDIVVQEVGAHILHDQVVVHQVAQVWEVLVVLVQVRVHQDQVQEAVEVAADAVVAEEDRIIIYCL